MKVIDLLNKIANNEETPEYIQYYNMLEDKTEIMWVCKENLIYKLDQSVIQLNSRIEPVEEENKMPSEININLAYIDKEYLLDKEDVDRKINEIINRHNILVDKVSDYIKSKGE